MLEDIQQTPTINEESRNEECHRNKFSPIGKLDLSSNKLTEFESLGDKNDKHVAKNYATFTRIDKGHSHSYGSEYSSEEEQSQDNAKEFHKNPDFGTKKATNTCMKVKVHSSTKSKFSGYYTKITRF